MKSLRLSAITLLLLLVGGAASVFAQSDRGTIRGTVTDPNGAGVPNARVTITGAETGTTRETTTNEQGTYVFPELQPTIYNITVEASGFQRSTIENFKVAVQVNHTVDIPLQVGVETTEVRVEAEAQALNADTPTTQTNVSERQVKELPLLVSSEAGGRTPLAFIFLDSNVSSTGENGNATDRGTSASRFRISGGQALGAEILIDGASTRRSQNGTFFSEVAPGPNAFQEFTISTGSYSAEFGNSAGGVINLIQKPGTNEFRGEAYTFIRNEAFNANSLFNKLNDTARDLDRQLNYGFNIGGPIAVPGFGEGTSKPIYLLRNRAFFFFNYEGYRFRQGENALITVPTARMRNGDFGELLTDPYIRNFRFADGFQPFPNGIRIYNPRLPFAQRNTPYPDNIVPTSDIDPAGRAILQFFPLPNRPGVFRNYAATSLRPIDMNQTTTKLNFNLSEDQRLTFSWSRRDQERVQNFNGGFPRFPFPFIAQDVGTQNFKSNFIRAQHNYNITPTILNNFNFGFNYIEVQNGNSTYGFNTASLGIPANATQNSAFPRINFPGYGDFVTSPDPRAYQNIGSTFFNDDLTDRLFDFSDFVTVVSGRQTIKAGASIRQSRYSVAQRIDPGGTFNFRNEQTAGNNANGQFDFNSGFPIASLITGATEFAFNFNNSIDPVFNQLTQAYFIQDDVKLTPKLTVNLGLRYELPNLRSESQDRFRTFDPNVINPAINRRGAIVSANATGALRAENRTLAPTDRSNIAPRVGIAYALDNKTVVRAGAGLYYNPILYGVDGGNELNTGLDGYNTGATFRCDDPNQTTDCRDSKHFLSSFPGIPQQNPNEQFVGQYDINGVQFFDQSFRNGRTFQYSVDLQRELPYKFVASVGYIGHRADRLRSNFQRLNALPLDALKLGATILNTNINSVTAPQRAFAQSLGITIPANGDAVYTGFNSSVAQALRPFPQYNRVRTVLESLGVSEYNSLQVKLERRFSQGIQFGASYTLARLVTNASEDLFGGSLQSGVLQNPFDRSSLKTDSPTLPRHVFVTNFLAELPFGKGRRFLNRGGFVNALVGGFQVSGVLRYQAGTPLVVFTSNRRGDRPELGNAGFLDLAGYGGNLRLNLTGQPLTLDRRTPVPGQPGALRILNRAAFTAAPLFNAAPTFLLENGQVNPAYTAYYADPTRFFGNAPAVLTDALTQPFFSEDLSILKRTRITETTALEIGAEFFNAFNRLYYQNPATDFENLNDFGVIRVGPNFESQRPRVIQFRARLIF